MAISITDTVKVCMEGTRVKWAIDVNDLTIVDNTRYVKLPRKDVTTSQFARMVMGATKVEGDVTSMCGSIGMTNIMRLRNDAQAEHMAGEDIPEGIADLLEAQPRPLKKKRTSRADQNDGRNSPSVVELQIPAIGEHPTFCLKVLRPVCSRDDLWVPLDKDVLESLITYLKEAGFGEDGLNRKRDTAIPAGIHVRTEPVTLKTFFLVQKTDGDQKRQKKVSSIEEALNVQGSA